MRPLLFAFVCGAVLTGTVSAQTTSGGQSGAPGTAVPPATQATPPAPAADTPAAGAERLEEGTDLFAQSWNTAQFGGRFTSVAGDAARFQRYQDLGSGPLFTGARLLRGTNDWTFNAGADNVGWRD